MTIPYLMNCDHDGDGWCIRCVARLGEETERLKAAIRLHRDQRGDNRCWIDDSQLYAVLGEGDPDLYVSALPPKCDFLKSCERYFESRQNPTEQGKAILPDEMTIEQLTAEVKRLRDNETGFRVGCD